MTPTPTKSTVDQRDVGECVDRIALSSVEGCVACSAMNPSIMGPRAGLRPLQQRHGLASQRWRSWQRRTGGGGSGSGGVGRPGSGFAARAAPEPQTSVQTPLAELEIAVPADQRPCNQLTELKGAWLYSWGALGELGGCAAAWGPE